MTQKHHLLLCFLVAVLLHALLLVPFMTQAETDGALDLGEDGLVVGVGLAGTFAETSTQQEKEMISESEHEPETETETETDETVADDVEPVPQESESVPEVVAPEAPREEAPEPVLPVEPQQQPAKPKKPEPEPKAEPKPEKTVAIQEEKAAPQPEAATNDTQVDNASKDDENSLNAQQATGTGDQLHSGGNPAAQQSYFSRIAARLSRYKRYPLAARRHGITGTATVQFVISKNGDLAEAKLIGSSGNKHLNQEALDVLRRASPFPRIPDDVSQGSLELRLPIEFSLNQKRKLF